jgi:signal transduction histidine kinase/DNA-binding response OmpR family regulator
VSAHGIRYIVIDVANQERVIFNDKIPFFLQSEKYFMESYHELTSYLQPTEKSLHGFKSGFITNISHELRTPLNGIMGIVEMLVKSQNLPEHEKEMANLAKRSGETLMGIINDILDYSRLEGGKLEVESIPFNLKDEVDSLIKEFIPEAREKKIVITTDFTTPLPVDFIGDPVRLRQVISNLLNNAIKFTPFGTVQITSRTAKTVNGGPAILISIKDSGIGIKQEKLETIFEPFSQADQSLSRKFGGTGLGTTISKHLVLLMGGEISAKSPSGLSPDPQYPGAEISFTLPLKTRKYLKSLDFTGIYSYAQLKCLVISDDPLQVQVISRNFIALGLDFKVLPPTRETLDLLIRRDPVHLVVIDHRYDFNGIEFLQEMYNHHLHKDHLIILQSSDYQSSNTTIAHRLGADVYLRKPIQLSTLREFILSNFPDLLAHEKEAILSVPEALKIMVIEDNLLNQKVIRNLLRKIGYDITIVVSVHEAFEVLNDCEFDLILADFYIIQSASSSVIADMKSRNFKCPIVVMASSFDLNDDTRNALLHSGVDDFLLKPFDMQLVSEVLFRMVAP